MKTLVQVISYLILVYGLALLTSCGSTPSTPATTTTTPQTGYIWRSHAVGSHKIVPVYMTPRQRTGYHYGDTVNVDLSTHRLNDTLQGAILCRLEDCITIN